MLLRLSEHNFIEALERLRLCLGSIGSSSGEATPQRRELGGDQEIGKEALQLTQLHGQFGHKYGTVYCIRVNCLLDKVLPSPAMCNFVLQKRLVE